LERHQSFVQYVWLLLSSRWDPFNFIVMLNKKPLKKKKNLQRCYFITYRIETPNLQEVKQLNLEVKSITGLEPFSVKDESGQLVSLS
jgi:hypothetical protein